MSNPRPDEFRRFHELLTERAPDEYTPWYFRVEAGSKAPDLSYGSWKDDSSRLSFEDAVAWMEQGGNVGIAGRGGCRGCDGRASPYCPECEGKGCDDALVNVDIDDDEETTPADVPTSLRARSRSRTGWHTWYFDATGDIPNIPTDDYGEVRTDWQYVVAPGSYVETDPEEVPAGEEDDAGYYTVEDEEPVATIEFEDLPDVFVDHHREVDQDDTDADVEYDFPGATGGGSSRQSALFDIDATDVVRKEGGTTDTDERWSSMFHGSDTDANMSVSRKGLIQCWRHTVTHNGLQALVVLSEYTAGCAAVGSGHSGSHAGDSCIKQEDGAHIWFAWKYAKQNGYLPDDDPVPYSALRYLCRDRDLCAVTEIPDNPQDGSLPAHAYDAALLSIENHDGLNPGRKQTDEIDDEDPSSLDVLDEESGDTQDANQTDGGATTATDAGVNPRRSFNDDVRQAIREFNDDVIQAKTARHRIAQALVDHHDYVYPEEEVRDWRSRLYVYNGDEGIYEPRGERHIEDKLEYAAGDFTTNQVTNEIVEKVKRMSAERDRAFTRQPERLVVGNGILNLHTGELSNYTPEEYHTTKLDVDWNPDAGDPEEIDRFLHDIVEDSDVDTLYRLVAHTLYKEYIGEKAAMLIGGGSNGKSMFLSLIEDFIGQWNVVHRELQDFGEDMYALNNLQGKLANLATEIGEQELDDTTAFKKATGRDTIDAPVKYERPITFENYATLMFATNEMPVFGQDNHAIWRRWVYVDFPYTFDADDAEAKDPEPERVIERRIKRDEEFEALLLRCQREIQRWYEGEPFFADSMDPDEVRDKMKKAAEPIYAFATSCLESTDDDEDYVEKSVVRAAYRAFADEEDLPRIADNEFGKRLLGQRDLSIESAQKKVEGSHIQVYKRVQLTSRGRQVLGIDTTDDEEQNEVDDRYEQARPKVLQRVREMFEDNGRDPVPKSGVVWGVSDVGKSTAEQALDRLIETGDVIEMSDDCVAPK